MKGVTLKNVPGVVWVCLTIAFTAVLAALVVMAAIGADSSELTRFLNLAMNTGLLVVSGAGAVYSGAAAKSAQDAAKQTNGDLDKRIVSGALRALEVQRQADTEPGGELRRE